MAIELVAIEFVAIALATIDDCTRAAKMLSAANNVVSANPALTLSRATRILPGELFAPHKSGKVIFLVERNTHDANQVDRFRRQDFHLQHN